MVVVSYSGKEINAKLVYYGPGLSGKTTNLEFIYSSVPSGSRGKMVSMKTRTERTLFFDFLPVDLGEMGGFKTRFLLYTVPGQVYYNATRKLVLRGVDGLIFVADSERGKMDENIESLQNLRANLEEYGLNLDEMPWVIQYNKRDLESVYTIDELEAALNPTGVPYFEATAMTGQGVFETFRGASHLLLEKLSKEVKLGDRSPGKPAAKPTQSPAAPRAEVPAAPRPMAAKPAPREPQPMPTTARNAPREVPAAPQPMRAKSAPPAPAPAPKSHPTPVAAEPAAKSAPVTKPAPVMPIAPTVQAAPAPAPVAAVEPLIQAVPVSVSEAPVSRPGFWSRLFGKKPTLPESSSRVVHADLGRSSGQGMIRRRVLVPVSLTEAELAQGGNLELILEIKLQSDSKADQRAA